MDSKEIRAPDPETENIEINLLLEGIYQKYGYDYRNYSRASLERRIFRRLTASNLKNISELTHAILYDRDFFERVLQDFSINVTEMFRDPEFYKAFREEVVPFLKTYPFCRIWIAGCSTGEEVYSLAILLHEEGLNDRVQIYATDINEWALQHARNGIYPVRSIRNYTENYQLSGGVKEFSDYYVAKYDSAIMAQNLKDSVIFAAHNLVTDGIFNEMQLIFCRNVLIYFNRDLQKRVVELFYNSLCREGFLCLGTKESLSPNHSEQTFELLFPHEKIYRKK